jgi:hypothetical protein
MPMVLMGVGGVIVAVGGLLWWGNMSGNFQTFPYAGYITMGIGGAIAAYGGKLKQQAAEKQSGGT